MSIGHYFGGREKTNTVTTAVSLYRARRRLFHGFVFLYVCVEVYFRERLTVKVHEC